MTALRWLLVALAGLASGVPSDLGGNGLADAQGGFREVVARVVRAAAPVGEPARLAATTLQSQGIAPEARRTRQPAASLGAPTFSRVVISPQGPSTFEGDGAPGSRVTVSIDGRVVGTQAVGPMGRWRVSLERPLPAGDHHIEASARLETGTQVLIGDEVRVAIPLGFSGSAVVAFDAARDGPAQRAAGAGSEAARPGRAPTPAGPSDGVRRRAEELADRASRGFDEIQRNRGGGDGPSEGREVAARQPPEAASDAVEGSWTDHVLDWLHRSNRDYQREIAGKLARGPQSAGAPAPEGVARPAGQPTAPDAAGEESARAAARERLFAEEEARRRAEREALLGQRRERSGTTDTAAKQHATRLPQEPAREVAPPASVREQVVALSEAELAAERAAAAEAEQRIEKRRRAAEESRLRAEARAREAASAEAIERRRAEEEAQRKLAEERKAAEAKRLADAAAERRRAEEEAQRRLAEERKETEARGLMAEEARRREAALRKQAEERMAAGAGKRPSDPPLGVAEAPSRPGGSRVPGAAAGSIEGPREPEARRAAGESGERRGQKQIAEGSAEEGPVERAEAPGGRGASARARRTPRPEPTVCRGRKAGLRVELPGVYLVRHGDTLWAIARRHYGSGARYPIIYRANRRTIADPDLIFPCQRLHLPRRGRRV